jgi:small subunit ribosomal protein S8
MMRHDLLSDVLVAMQNGDKLGKNYIMTGASDLVKGVLLVLQKKEFIGEFEYVEDNSGGQFKINLLGKINASRSIRPRFSVNMGTYNKYKRRFLPASGFGMVIVTTSQGVMDHREAQKKKIGGKLLAYVY